MRRALLIGVMAALTSTTAAQADDLVASRFELFEVADTIDVRLDRGVATLVVTRTVENRGPKSDQAVFYLDMPGGAVATRLRTQGAHGEWFEGELLEAEEAAKRYHELTGVGGYYPKDPALLSWRTPTRLALQVFPVPATGRKTVEYTLTMPMRYEAGHYALELPVMATEQMSAKVHFSAVHGEDGVEVNGVSVSPASTVSAARAIEVELVPREVPLVDGALASFEFAPDRHLLHARIAAAPRLSEIPARAAVVILLDVSRSMEPRGAQMLTLAREYASWFPGSDVELLTFDRKVTSPFKGALSGREITARLHAWKPVFANGSQLDDGLARADALLASSPLASRRILLVTDLETRNALGPDKVKGLGSGAILHVATIDESGQGPKVSRDDDDAWAVVPRKTGGLLWRAGTTAGRNGELHAVIEELARPVRIDKLTVSGLDEGFFPPSELLEGTGIEHFVTGTKAVPRIGITGELWSKAVSWSAAASASEGKTWSALAFGAPIYTSLSEAEQMTLAKNGHAVSPVTSFLAIEPGVRPSTDGLDPYEQGFGSGYGRLAGSHLTMSPSMRSGKTSTFDPQAWLDDALGGVMDSCGAVGDAAVTVENTGIEIVDVREVSLAKKPKQGACILEGIWQLALPGDFDAHDVWKLAAHR